VVMLEDYSLLKVGYDCYLVSLLMLFADGAAEDDSHEGRLDEKLVQCLALASLGGELRSPSHLFVPHTAILPIVSRSSPSHTPVHTLTDLAPDLIRLLSDCVSSEVPFCVPFSSPKETDARSVSVLGAGLLSSPCPYPLSLFPVILKSKSFESLPISPNSLPIVVAV
jgi:hypothetical protein